MKNPLTIIKSWFVTGATPTQAQFEDTFDSFHHKDDGEVISEKNINNNIVTLKFSDNSEIVIESNNYTSNGWIDIPLTNGTTAIRSRYRIVGYIVEVELYVIRQGRVHTHCCILPLEARPSNQMFFAGYNIIKTRAELFSIKPNGEVTFIDTSNIGSDACALTVQYLKII